MKPWWNRAYLGSAESMAAIPDASVHCCVTSPPYFGLRDYGVEGQIGLEASLAEYVDRLVDVFREVRRVLRDDGTLWLNLGDSYYTHVRGSDSGWDKSRLTNPSRIQKAQAAALSGRAKSSGEAKEKDLLGVPWAVAFALRADGWWLRDAIVWAKPNPMPSSVDDRCTPSYETVFMLAKSARYFADMDAVRQPATAASIARLSQPGWEQQRGSDRANCGAKTNGPMKAVAREKTARDPNVGGLRQAPEPGEDGAFSVMPDGSLGANMRNVWTIATTPYADAHFATFPRELPSRCIRIGSPEGGIVLDPFMGSGTTAEAAEALGRRWVGYEINPEYHTLIAERTRQAGLFGGAVS